MHSICILVLIYQGHKDWGHTIQELSSAWLLFRGLMQKYSVGKHVYSSGILKLQWANLAIRMDAAPGGGEEQEHLTWTYSNSFGWTPRDWARKQVSALSPLDNFSGSGVLKKTDWLHPAAGDD